MQSGLISAGKAMPYRRRRRQMSIVMNTTEATDAHVSFWEEFLSQWYRFTTSSFALYLEP